MVGDCCYVVFVEVMEWFVIGWVVIVFDYVFDYCGGVLGFLDCVLSYFGYVGYEY